MDDPYKVLGLKRGATDEEIKAAYHELVKKYHPDKYQNNPLSDLAEEKLREVNEAYDLLMKPSTATSSSYNSYSGGNAQGQGSYTYGNYNNGNYNSYNSGNYSGSGYGYDHGQGGGYGSYSNAENSSHYDVRVALDRNQIDRAEQLLNLDGNRDAEWYFLAGVLSYKRGYVDDALSKLSYAISLEPRNAEFRGVYQQIRGTGALYKTTSSGRGYNSSFCSDLIMCYCCSSLISPCW